MAWSLLCYDIVCNNYAFVLSVNGVSITCVIQFILKYMVHLMGKVRGRTNILI